MYHLITFCNRSVMYRKNKKYDTKFLYGDSNDYLYEIFLVIFEIIRINILLAQIIPMHIYIVF